MTQTVSSRALACLLFAVSLSPTHSPIASSQPETTQRVITLVPGRPIRDQIRESDRALRVRSTIPPPEGASAPEGMSLAEWKATWASFVAVINVRTLDSHLTESGDWIMTNVVADVLEPIKSPAEFSGLSSVEFQQPGGQLDIDGRSVTAEAPWLRSMTIGKAYLVFGRVDDDGRLQIGGQDAYELSANRLLSLRALPDAKRDAIEASPLADSVLEVVRRRSREQGR